MKKIKIEKTKITESKVKFEGQNSKTLDYKDLIELALDIVPQGGFTPKDIKDRNRIQEALDKANTVIELEDADYQALVGIMSSSRWMIRDSELNTLLENFSTGVYEKPEPKK